MNDFIFINLYFLPKIVADFSDYSFSQKPDYSQDFKGSPFSLSIFYVISKMCNTFNNEIKVSLIKIPNKFHLGFPTPEVQLFLQQVTGVHVQLLIFVYWDRRFIHIPYD